MNTMTDDSSTYHFSGLTANSISLAVHDSVSYDAVSLISVVSILILLLLSEGNILLGIIS